MAPEQELLEGTEKAAEKTELEEQPVRVEEEKGLKEAKGEKQRELKARVGLAEKAKAILTGKIKIKEKDIKELLDEFELSLLESDVELDAAKEIVSLIKESLVGKELSSKQDVSTALKEELRKALHKIMETENIDIFKEMEKKKPFIVLFLGPNGAGKTTSIAKLTYALQKKGKKVVWAAADTFRAASIEQLEEHAGRLGVNVVKHKYGSDPAAVAFDAVGSAKAKNTDVVLIDSAGRQETNRNLMEELKKIARVVKPDLKVYVGEAFTGQALLQQAKEFDEALKLDCFILTKIDADVKGGTAISLLFKLRKPILFIGTGQNYEDLVEFKPKYIIERVLG
ncbi:MAG: signal recognition particle-docking protein FtsY [Candidatus Diapherotrites archaeon]|uniref:Signal recognition particle receptor FtsY n=1 Tax=Candidatus Iainarchaeum sp. TaxID=3101447 RepID=A0A7J4IU89_9ARCH|nr:signal recognition particle-docking protein FtsY [Candidatus Diapherotrites archaeon]HIH09002.1 signal recognition particle-docking protein FtsY [Candidatus Diapherotrites archaeon]